MSRASKGGTLSVYLPSDVYEAYSELPLEKRREFTTKLREVAKFMLVNGNIAVISCNDLKTLIPFLSRLLNQILSIYTTSVQNTRAGSNTGKKAIPESAEDVIKAYVALYALLLKQCSYDDYVILKHTLETRHGLKVSV